MTEIQMTELAPSRLLAGKVKRFGGQICDQSWNQMKPPGRQSGGIAALRHCVMQ
jgi:hypothetical protein